MRSFCCQCVLSPLSLKPIKKIAFNFCMFSIPFSCFWLKYSSGRGDKHHIGPKSWGVHFGNEAVLSLKRFRPRTKKTLSSRER